METKTCNESRVVKTSRIFPSDVNDHNTLFGGKLMSDIDMTASISATRHCRKAVVTASTDSVDFLAPISPEDSVCLESYVSWTGNSSMEVFVKVTAENLMTGERKIAATAFLTFVAMDESGKPTRVPKVIPETAEEKKLNETAVFRADKRKENRKQSKELAEFFTTNRPWER
ncbi:acyl-CoA thioesterase [Pradoshia eiseniae]|uniref:Acyl-CoA thioesterase n=1 Tax=Pradoshia eiseniae TaxID=2064768 RepID=A0A2S7MZR7_9BACI|nr:acyl-CoA thioesterase [Pradoshia eiseniae]PQD95237.1 acyl-CoA thioesterase [Pradoshia eiseniae]